MNDIVISIDIGLSGGIAFYDAEERAHAGLGLLMVKDMPTTSKVVSDKTKRVLDVEHLLHLLEIPNKKGETATVVMEDVHAFPGQGVVAVGTLLEQKGIIIGMSKALGYDVCLVSPKTWQKQFDIVCPKELKAKAKRKKMLKDLSLKKAHNIFNDWFDKILDKDGISDALLIGHWYLLKEPQ